MNNAIRRHGQDFEVEPPREAVRCEARADREQVGRCPHCGKPDDGFHAYGTRGYACDARPARD